MRRRRQHLRSSLTFSGWHLVGRSSIDDYCTRMDDVTLPVHTLPKLAGVETGVPPPLRPAYAPEAAAICQFPARKVAVHSSSQTMSEWFSSTIVPTGLTSTFWAWMVLPTNRAVSV